jgi:hypothetical protein
MLTNEQGIGRWPINPLHSLAVFFWVALLSRSFFSCCIRPIKEGLRGTFPALRDTRDTITDLRDTTREDTTLAMAIALTITLDIKAAFVTGGNTSQYILRMPPIPDLDEPEGD